jgi:hypothetical protein
LTETCEPILVSGFFTGQSAMNVDEEEEEEEEEGQ